jgi:3-methyladenine DNA glycosylase AlkC
MTKPKGARRLADVPSDVRAELNAGVREAANLMESLAVDFAVLLRAAAPTLSDAEIAAVAAAGGIVQRMQAAGELLAQRFGAKALEFREHPSDTVRGWSAFALAALPGNDVRRKLALVESLADDRNYGVREWAWMAVRPAVAEELNSAVRILAKWARKKSANVRRFASECTRPCGVWCRHLAAMKETPELGLPILEPLRADESKYVQNSVGNWLSDAAKTQPHWVEELCRRWERESDEPATRRICTRARRNLRKK